MGLNRKRSEYAAHSKRVCKGPRWKALRLQVLERDGWACVECGSHIRLEIDHVESVKDRPDLAYSLGNLQALCGRCHARKTRLEVGHKPLPPDRQEWRNLLRSMDRDPSQNTKDFEQC